MTRPRPFAAIAFAGGAFLLSLAMAPGEQEIAAMDIRDDSFGSAASGLESVWRSGDRSETTLAQLARAYIGAGEVDAAVAAFREFLGAHPGHRQAADALLRTYRDGQRLDERYDLAKDLARESDDQAFILETADAAATRQDVKAEEALLRRAGGIAPLEGDRVRRLASLAARRGGYREALDALATLSPNRETSSDAAFAFRLALDAGLTDRAIDVAARDVKLRQTPATIYVNGLNAYSSPDAARSLLGRLEAPRGAEDLLSRGDLLLSIGDRPGAVAAARMAYAQAPDAKQRTAALGLLVEAGDRDAIAKAVEDGAFKDLSPQQVVILADALLDQGDAKAAEMALANAGPAFVERHPALSARLALALGRKKEAKRILRRALKSPDLTPVAAVSLAEVATSVGDAASVREAARRFPSVENADAATLEAMAAYYVRLGVASQHLATFSNARQKLNRPAADRAWARLAAAAGDPKAVAAWIQAEPEAAAPALGGIAASAMDRRAFGLARLAAEEAARRTPSREAQSYLAYVRHKTGDHQGALATLDGLKPLGRDERQLYAAAAAAIGDKARLAAALSPDLRRGGRAGAAALNALLQAGQFKAAEPELRKRALRGEVDLLYAYGAAAKRRRALPRFQKFVAKLAAETNDRPALEASIAATREAAGLDAALKLQRDIAARLGGQWAEDYEYALAAAGRGEAAARHRVARAASAGHDERLQIVDALIADGRRRKAESILLELAAERGPTSAAADRLFGLWARNADAERRGWTAERAARARAPAERVGWLRRLADIGGDREAFDVIANAGESVSDREAALAAELAGRLRNKAEARRGLAAMAPRTSGAVGRAAVGRAASYLGDPATAYALLRSAASSAADFRAFATSAAALGRHRQAADALDRYLAMKPNDAAATLDLGYAAEAAGDYRRASVAFQQAGALARRTGRDDTEALLAAARMLRRAGDRDGALARLAALDRARPDDPRARAAYVEALLEAGRPEEARRALDR